MDNEKLPARQSAPEIYEIGSKHVNPDIGLLKTRSSFSDRIQYYNLPVSGLNPSILNKGANYRNSIIEDFISRRTGSSPSDGPTIRVPDRLSVTGTVTYVDLEGGFYGIVTDDQIRYIPGNLPEKYRVDGLRVEFIALSEPDSAGIQMWGTPVRIISIQEATGTIQATGEVTWISLEGGFYGIVTHNGINYLPLGLPEEFARNGIKVEFTAIPSPETATIAMWGVPVKIIAISMIGEAENGGEHLNDSSWTLVRYADGEKMRDIIPGIEITAGFEDTCRISGTTGCNHYFAECAVSGSSLQVGTTAMTMMYCMEPEGVMEQEQQYLFLLSGAATYEVQEGRLLIHDEAGRLILEFEKFKP